MFLGRYLLRGAPGFLALLALMALAGCSGSPLTMPPTPTPNPAAAAARVQNHQHGEAGGGLNSRLVTKYGGPVAVSLATLPTSPRPGAPFTITYALKDKAGAPIPPGRLQITHEKLMHLIVVSQDLTEFAHVHPREVGDGRYSVESRLGAGGKYLLYNEFVTAEGVTQIERHEVTTEGASASGVPAQPVPDLGKPQEVGGLTVVMTSTQQARRRAPATFTLFVTKDGKPVTDLEPYLGAPCHVVAISADTKQFAHTHGDIPGGAMSGDMSKMGGMNMAAMPTPPAHFGPRLQFTHTFMQAGLYRVWAQFGYAGEVVTVGYNVAVGK